MKETESLEDKYSSTFLVFSQWRCIRRERVSIPCNSINALNGDRQAPKSRVTSARRRRINA